MSAFDAFMYNVPAMRQDDAAESARAAERFREKLANDEIIVRELAAKKKEIEDLRDEYEKLGFSLRPSVRSKRKQVLALYNKKQSYLDKQTNLQWYTPPLFNQSQSKYLPKFPLTTSLTGLFYQTTGSNI